jgi:hypothetical protein
MTSNCTLLQRYGFVNTNDSCRYRPKEYDTEPGPKDPITGGAAALLGSLGDFALGVADIPSDILRAIPLPSSLSQRTGSKIGSRAESRRATPDSMTPPASPATSAVDGSDSENAGEGQASAGSNTKSSSRFRFVFQGNTIFDIKQRAQLTLFITKARLLQRQTPREFQNNSR